MQTDPHDDYALGSVPFCGVQVRLDSRPLIPRVETEYWVAEALKSIPADSPVCVLDLFAGSGCIGLSILKHRPNTFVTFGEVEQSHLATIAESIKDNALDQRHVFLIHSDVWSAIDGRFDFIFANPPYISKERNTVSESALQSEPHEALFADEDGYAYIRQTIDGLPKALANKGVCYIEHEPHHTDMLAQHIQDIWFVIETKKDQYGVNRYSRIHRSAVA